MPPSPIDFSALEGVVSEFETVEPGVEALLKSLFDAVEANKNAPTQLQAIVDRGRARLDALKAAVVANTPAGPVEPPPPPPPPEGRR